MDQPDIDDMYTEIDTSKVDTRCGLIDWLLGDCYKEYEVLLKLICRTCGEVMSQVCVDCFWKVPTSVGTDELRCTAQTPGRSNA